MKQEDMRSVLNFAPQRGSTPDKRPGRPAPDDLQQAIAALRGALEAEVTRASQTRNDTQNAPETESFSPVGAPSRHRPTWRAGSDLPPGRGGSQTRGVMLKGANTGPATDRDALSRRITAIHLPRFSIERWQRIMEKRGDAPPDDLPHALAVEGAHGPVIHATNRAAEQAGVVKGARVVDMRALCPELAVDFADLGGDRAALDKLMLWARRWCPWTVTDGLGMNGAGLVMDTTGSDHLMGGEAAMLREIEEQLARLGLSASLATAPTHGAAWALSRFGGVRDICAADGLGVWMGPLPVRALRLAGDTVTLLKRLGLQTVGDLAMVPRISLARRFSRAALVENPLLRLDQMMGRLAEPVNAPDDPPRFAVQARLAEPVQDPSDWVPGLCDELCGGLGAAGFGARRLVLTVYRTDGEVASVEVATSQPSRDAAHLARLFDGKLDRIDPGFGFDLITLGASVAETMTVVQTRLDGGADDGTELARLIDRLTARLGAGAIRAPIPRDSHIPERAEDWTPALHQQNQKRYRRDTDAIPTRYSPRPLRLFDHPEEIRVVYAVPEGPPAQFVWRRITHKVTRFEGPERIAPEWWQDLPGTRLRDYYRVEDHTGKRIWIYRDGVLGDGRGATPRWFVHGVFA